MTRRLVGRLVIVMSCLREIKVLGRDFKATVIVEKNEEREEIDPKIPSLVGWVGCDV